MVAARLASMPAGSNQRAQMEAPSQPKAAKTLVRRLSVQQAKVVQQKAAPALAKRVEQYRWQ